MYLTLLRHFGKSLRPGAYVRSASFHHISAVVFEEPRVQVDGSRDRHTIEVADQSVDVDNVASAASVDNITCS